MLPFLNKNYKQSGVIVHDRKPDEKPEEKDQEDQGLMACMQDLKKALESGDMKAASVAFKAAFQSCDEQPHVEGEHVSPHTYDAQNRKAGQE